jgi:hypothetical protein
MHDFSYRRVDFKIKLICMLAYFNRVVSYSVHNTVKFLESKIVSSQEKRVLYVAYIRTYYVNILSGIRPLCEALQIGKKKIYSKV